MKELALYNLKEGMVLAKDITTPSGQVVLEKGKELTKQSILRLSFYNIKSACIVDGEEKQAAPKSYSQKIKTSQKFQSFQVDHTIVLSQIRVSFEGYVNEGKPLDTSALLSKVVELFQSCKTSLELFNMLHNMHSSDDSVYVHSLNVSLICRQIGKWIKADDATLDMLTLAGLLHDIGKALTQEVEGSHVQLGVDIAKKYKENREIVHAIEAHHGDVEPQTLVAMIVDAADDLSAARPGARREDLENYIKRLKKLEDIANSFAGVEKSFAIQAGREIRIMVKPEEVSDESMVLVAKDIVKKIESELEYPGQIKIHMIRESRAIDYAR